MPIFATYSIFMPTFLTISLQFVAYLWNNIYLWEPSTLFILALRPKSARFAPCPSWNNSIFNLMRPIQLFDPFLLISNCINLVKKVWFFVINYMWFMVVFLAFLMIFSKVPGTYSTPWFLRPFWVWFCDHLKHFYHFF